MTRTIANFQTELSGSGGFRDELNDSSIHSNWTLNTPQGGSSITEDSAKLTISDTGGAAKDWFTSPFTASNANMSVEPYNFTAKVFVDGIVSTSTNSAGLILYENGDKSNHFAVLLENNGSDGYIYSYYDGANTHSYTIDYTGYCWLAIARRGGTILLAYHQNGYASEPDFNQMVNVRPALIQTFQLNENRIALVGVTKAAGYPAIAAEFRKFRLTYP